MEFGIRITADGRVAVTEAGKVESALGEIGKGSARGAKETTEALRRIPAEAGKVEESIKRIGHRTTMTSKEAANALRMLPAQMTDIGVGLATGQSPFMVLLQQGGQLKDMFGGIGPAARAVGGYVANLVNPFTVAAAAAAALVAAFAAGDAEAANYRKALALTGHASGVTASQLAELARQTATTAGTQGAAAEDLARLVAGGRVAAEALGTVAAALATVRNAGGDAERLLDQLEAIGKDPVKGIKALDEQFHFLTASIYDEIRALDEAGNREAAATLAQTEAARAAKQRAEEAAESAGFLERAWHGVAAAVRKAWDDIKGVGRQSPLADQVRDAEDQVARLQAVIARGETLPGMTWIGRDAALESARARLDQLREQLALEDVSAASGREQNRLNLEYQRTLDGVMAVQAKGIAQQKTLTQALAEYRAELDKLRRQNPDSAALAADKVAAGEAAIRAQFASRTKAPADPAGDQWRVIRQRLAEDQREIEAKIRGELSSQRAQAAMQQTVSGLTSGFTRDNARTAEAQMPAAQRQLAESLRQVEERAQAAREALAQKAAAVGDDAAALAAYRQALVDVNAAEQAQKDAVRDAWDAQQRLNASWEYGAGRALQEYGEQVKNVAQQTHDAMARAFQGMEDALVQFVTKGKLDFRSLVSSILEEIVRIQIQRSITGPLSDAIGDSLPSLAKMFFPNAQGGAYAGPGISAYENTVVTRPTLFPFAKGIGLMGEKPGSPGEAIMPLTRMPGGDLGVKTTGAGGGNTVMNVSVEVHADGSRVQGDSQGAMELGNRFAAGVRSILISEKRAGGLLAGA